MVKSVIILIRDFSKNDTVLANAELGMRNCEYRILIAVIKETIATI
ncbi:MAG: hypothetical protein ABIK93_03925 [candidate division WOR-3 bacterium]